MSNGNDATAADPSVGGDYGWIFESFGQLLGNIIGSGGTSAARRRVYQEIRQTAAQYGIGSPELRGVMAKYPKLAKQIAAGRYKGLLAGAPAYSPAARDVVTGSAGAVVIGAVRSIPKGTLAAGWFGVALTLAGFVPGAIKRLKFLLGKRRKVPTVEEWLKTQRGRGGMGQPSVQTVGPFSRSPARSGPKRAAPPGGQPSSASRAPAPPVPWLIPGSVMPSGTSPTRTRSTGPGGQSAAARDAELRKKELDVAKREGALEEREKAARATAPAPVPVTPPIAKPWWQQLLGVAQPLLFPTDDGARAVARPTTIFNVAPQQSISPTPIGYLTPLRGPGVSSPSDKCKCPPKRKGKPRKPRSVCWTGTYTERPDGLTKSRRRKVPCRQSRKRPRSQRA